MLTARASNFFSGKSICPPPGEGKDYVTFDGANYFLGDNENGAIQPPDLKAGYCIDSIDEDQNLVRMRSLSEVELEEAKAWLESLTG